MMGKQSVQVSACKKSNSLLVLYVNLKNTTKKHVFPSILFPPFVKSDKHLTVRLGHSLQLVLLLDGIGIGGTLK